MQVDDLLLRRGSKAIVTPRTLCLSKAAFRESRYRIVSVRYPRLFIGHGFAHITSR